jgi:hypothetical protein
LTSLLRKLNETDNTSLDRSTVLKGKTTKFHVQLVKSKEQE